VRSSYLLLAAATGAIGFALVEAAGARAGVLTGLTASLALDAASYVLASLLLASAFASLFRGASRWVAPFVVLSYLVLYAPATAIIAAALDLTLSGSWGVGSVVRGAFINTPVNLIYTFVLTLPAVAVPAGIVSAGVLWWGARRLRRPHVRAAAA
jgi:hypothetical protein